MVDQTDIEAAETTEDHYRFQFRDRSEFDELVEAPDWARKTAESVSDGATVRMGSVPDSENLQIESVLVPRKPNVGQEDAKNIAEKIVEKIRA